MTNVFLYTRTFFNDQDFWELCAAVNKKSSDSTVFLIPTNAYKAVLKEKLGDISDDHIITCTDFFSSSHSLSDKTLFVVGLHDMDPRFNAKLWASFQTVKIVTVLVYHSGFQPQYAYANRQLSWFNKEGVQTVSPKYADTLPFYPQTTLNSFDTTQQEMAWVVARLQTVAFDQLHTVAVFIPDITSYKRELIRQLNDAKIPIKSLSFLFSETRTSARFFHWWSQSQKTDFDTYFNDEPDLYSEKEALKFLKQMWQDYFSKRLLLSLQEVKTYCRTLTFTVNQENGIRLIQDFQLLSSCTFLFCTGFSQQHYPPLQILRRNPDREIQDDFFMFRFFEAAYNTSRHIYLTVSPQSDSSQILPSTYMRSLKEAWGIFIDETHHSEPRLTQSKTVTPPVYKPDPGYIHPESFSITQLEHYQRCPTSYFFNTVCRLPAPDQPLSQVPRSQWGTRIHAILRDFSIQETHANSRSEKEALLRRLAGFHFSDFSPQFFAWSVKEKTLWDEDAFRGLFSELLRLYEDPFPYRVAEAEASFIYTFQHDNQPFSIKGRFDAVYKHIEKSYILIMDYKTGKQLPTRADYTEKRSLQLPLYHVASKQQFKDSTTVGTGIIQLFDGHHVQRKIQTLIQDCPEDADIQLNRIKPFMVQDDFEVSFNAHLAFLIGCIKANKFSPDSHELLPHMESQRTQTCMTCGYRSICSYSKR